MSLPPIEADISDFVEAWPLGLLRSRWLDCEELAIEEHMLLLPLVFLEDDNASVNRLDAAKAAASELPFSVLSFS